MKDDNVHRSAAIHQWVKAVACIIQGPRTVLATARGRVSYPLQPELTIPRSTTAALCSRRTSKTGPLFPVCLRLKFKLKSYGRLSNVPEFQSRHQADSYHLRDQNS